MMDIEVLRFIWWLLLGFLIIAFAVTDGFDFGAAILFPFVGRTETERRIVLNSIGPFWEGNQVWIILGAGAIFAAWPMVYAVAFSGFYFLILLLLLTMGISRPVSFKYRSKLENERWRKAWDHVVFIGGLFPSFIFGILMANVMTGIPFYFDKTLRISNEGAFFSLFTPFSIWCGLTSMFMLMMHGGLYLAIKTDDPIRQRSLFYSQLASLLFILFFALGGVWIAKMVSGFEVTSIIDPRGYSNPLMKEVITAKGAWLKNYANYPITILAPALGFIGAIIAFLFAKVGTSKFAFVGSGISITGVIATVGFSMFPFILPSSVNLSSSLLVWDASSSALTLFMMLAAVIIFMPIILIYTAWVYRALRGKVRNDIIDHDEKHTAY